MAANVRHERQPTVGEACRWMSARWRCWASRSREASVSMLPLLCEPKGTMPHGLLEVLVLRQRLQRPCGWGMHRKASLEPRHSQRWPIRTTWRRECEERQGLNRDTCNLLWRHASLCETRLQLACDLRQRMLEQWKQGDVATARGNGCPCLGMRGKVGTDFSDGPTRHGVVTPNVRHERRDAAGAACRGTSARWRG